MTKRVMVLLILALAFLAAGCEFTQYDHQVSDCSVSNGKTEIEIFLSRDSDKTDNDRLPPNFLKACAILQER